MTGNGSDGPGLGWPAIFIRVLSGYYLNSFGVAAGCVNSELEDGRGDYVQF